MKIIKIIVLISATLWLCTGYADNSSSVNQTKASPNSCMMLKSVAPGRTLNVYFVQSASAGNVKVLDKQKGIYKLTLKKFNPIVVYFSDRPQRVVHSITIGKFLTLWKEGADSLKNNPPNASLSAVTVNLTKGVKTLDLFLALTNPQYNKKDGTLTYTAFNLDQSMKIPDSQNFHYITLFIDSGTFCTSCI